MNQALSGKNDCGALYTIFCLQAASNIQSSDMTCIRLMLCRELKKAGL